MNKKLILFLLLLAVIAGAAWFFASGNKIKSYEFNGNLVDVQENSIILKGAYKVENSTQLPSAELKEPTVEVTGKTKITRISISIPDTSEPFMIDDLPTEESPATLDTLYQDFTNTTGTIGVKVRTERDIYNKNKFKASEIIYRVPVFSVPR